jgi:multidrug efflux pump subunit AcrA (membrane-fusion protein)
MITRFVLPLVGIGMLAFAIVHVVNARTSRAILPPPEPPAHTTFPHTVGAVGLVEASSENIAISTPVSGLVTTVYVRAGDRVRASDRLFTLDDRDLQAELMVRRAMLEVARQRLGRLVAQPRAEEVPPAEAKLREAEAVLGDAEMQLQLIERVTDRRAIRQEDLHRRRFAVEAARARRDEARAALNLLNAGAWRPEVETARAEVKQAETQVQRVQADIERLTINAPVMGAVLQSNVRPGEYAQSGPLATPLMLLGSVDQLNIRIDVDEQDAWRVKPDALARAAVRGNAGLSVPIHFVRFEPYVIPKRALSGATTERVDTRVLQVIYRLDRAKFPLYVGQQLDVFIEGYEPGAAAPLADGSPGGVAPATVTRPDRRRTGS